MLCLNRLRRRRDERKCVRGVSDCGGDGHARPSRAFSSVQSFTSILVRVASRPVCWARFKATSRAISPNRVRPSSSSNNSRAHPRVARIRAGSRRRRRSTARTLRSLASFISFRPNGGGTSATATNGRSSARRCGCGVLACAGMTAANVHHGRRASRYLRASAGRSITSK
jgi:hypothetical protein